jgi:hypothetical protein
MLCEYGCGQEATNQTKSNKHICGKGASSCPVNKLKNSTAGKKAYQTFRQSAKLQYCNLKHESKDRMAANRGKFTADFSVGGGGSHKKVLLKERGHRCECCNNTEWLGKPITIELEHIDGNNKNNAKENLKLLCPNCHSQTETWRGKNINTGRTKIPDEILIKALQETKNIRAALIKVGLTPKGGNYDRAKKLLTETI